MSSSRENSQKTVNPLLMEKPLVVYWSVVDYPPLGKVCFFLASELKLLSCRNCLIIPEKGTMLMEQTMCLFH